MQHKTIGLIGGIGWASSALYYRRINELTAQRLGPAHSARIVLLSMDQFDFTSRAALENPAAIHALLVAQAQRLQAAGADFFMLCANGAHRFAPALLPQLSLPFVSIVEATAQRVRASGARKVGLLGVRQTMNGRFYQDALAGSEIAVITPAAADQEIIHDIIYSELVHHRISAASRAVLVRIISELAAAGADGVILGCTELPLLISQHDVATPLFDTTDLHCAAAMAYAFDGATS